MTTPAENATGTALARGGLVFSAAIIAIAGKPLNDHFLLWHWQIVVQVDNITELTDTVQVNGGHLVSPGSVAMKEATFKTGKLVRGPSEHALLLINQ